MEVNRRQRILTSANMQENICVGKAKPLVTAKGGGLQALPTKRAALGNINTNIRLQPNINAVNKAKPCVVNEAEKVVKPALRPITRSYKNVNSKIDTGYSKLTSGIPKICDENNPKSLLRTDSTSLAAEAGRITDKLKQAKISNSKTSSKENLVPKETGRTKKSDSSNGSNIAKIESTTDKELQIFGARQANREAYSTELLDGVEDIDSKDEKSPLLMGIYIKDIYNYLMELEMLYPIREQHLRGQAVVTPKMRATLIDWLVEVHNQFHLTLETLHMTVAIIDRYLQAVQTIKRTQIQLVGITALFIASKYEEMYVPDIQDFVFITDYTYSKPEILHCEKVILAELKFNLGRPLQVHFERRFIKAAGAKLRDHHLAKFLIDLCLVEYHMAHYRPSEIAAAAVCLSISVLSTKPPQKCWTPTIQFYSGYKFEDIEPIVKKIAKIAISTESARCKAVVTKYQSTKYGQVSSYPELKESTIKEIAKDADDC